MSQRAVLAGEVRRVARSKCLGAALVIVLAAMAPLVLTVPYLRHLLVIGALNVALALSFDLLAGHVGAVSLAHPAFFGLGAYTAAVLNTRWLVPAGVTLPAALLAGGLVAAALAVPFFRLSELSFAIGTLGLSLVAQAVANNWVDVTGGAMCLTGIAAPARTVLGAAVSPQVASYYLAAGIALGSAALYHLSTTFRLGRALAAVQGDETFASSFGFNPLRYKVLAFTLSGMVAAVVGGFYAHYANVICPNDLSTFLTINLLVMVFVGGLGSLRGVLVGAAVFTVVPELARFAQVHSQLIYGILLLITVIYAPEGLDRLLQRSLRLRTGGRAA